MNDTELDRLMQSAAAPLPEAATAEAARMAREAMPSRLRRGKAPLPRWLRPAAFAGVALVLTAGAGTTAYTMSNFGGVSMPLGNIRNTVPIPVTWTTTSGVTESCNAWIELQNPAPGDPAALDAAVKAHDWAGLGQRLYDQTPPVADDADGQRRVGDGLDPVLQSFAQSTFPGISWFPQSASARGVAASGFRCAAPESK